MEEQVTKETTAIDETLAEGLGSFMDKLTIATEHIADQLATATPQVWEVITTLVQVKGVIHLAIGALIILIGFAGGRWCITKLAKNYAEEEAKGKYVDPEGYTVVTGIIIGIVGCVCIFGAISLFSPYNWISAIFPEGAIALKALEAVDINL